MQTGVLLSVTGSRFVNSSAVSGGSIELQTTYASNVISSSVFNGYLNPMFVHIFSSNLEISTSTFSQIDQYDTSTLTDSELSTLMNGTAVALEGLTNFNLHG